jgi:Tol biopolymer transport system component
MRAWYLGLLAACGRIDFQPIAADAGCVLGPWSTPERLAELDADGDDQGPVLTADGLTIYYHSPRAGTAGIDLYTATRRSPTGRFGAPVVLTALGSANNDRDPALAAGGNRLYFSSDRLTPGMDSLFVTTRTGDLFSTPVLVDGIGPDVYGPFLSDDETELFYSAGGHLCRAIRSTPGDTWTDLGPIPELMSPAALDGFPSLTGDGLTMVFETTRRQPIGVFVAVRSRRDAAFSEAIPVAELNDDASGSGDPAISLDGRTIVFDSDRPGGAGGDDLYESTRACQ